MRNRSSFALLGASAICVATLASAPISAATVNGPYEFTILAQTRALQQNDRFRDSAMLENGSVAVIVQGGTSVLSPPDRIRIIAPDGTTAREIAAPLGVSFGAQVGGGLSVNERGQIAVAAADENRGRRQLLLIEPDGAVRTLIDSPSIQPAGVADSSLTTFSAVKINEAGEIAAVGSARDEGGRALTRVIKVSDTSSDAPSIAILDQQTPQGTPPEASNNPLFDVAIDDAGTVAWARQTGGDFEVALSDGATERVALFSRANFSSGRVRYAVSALTNGGLLAVAASPGSGGDNSVGTSNVENGLADEDYAPAFSTPRLADRWDANEFGQSFALIDSDRQGAGVIVGGEIVAEAGAVIDGVALGRAATFDGFFRAVNGEFANDAGQLAFEAFGRADLDGNGSVETYNLVVRADPIGATPDHPILPAAQNGAVATVAYEIVNALGLTTPIYVDPDPAARFDYAFNSGPLVTSLVIPEQPLGAEDGVFEILFGGFSERLVFDQTLDFTAFAGFDAGVSTFSILGIDAGAGVATDDPFIVGLIHAGLGAADLTITGRAAGPTAPIPLPAGGWMLVSALGLLALRRRRR